MATNENLGSIERRHKISSLDKWLVFSLMKEGFVYNIRSFIICGDKGNEVIVVTKDDVVFHMNVNNITQMTELSELRDKAVCKIAAGLNHVCALTSAGDVYNWGNNNNVGQLGTGNTRPSRHPIQISFNRNFVDIECGSLHTLALTDAGHVYAWGGNSYGQLGNGNTANQSTPINIHGCRVKSIVCGYFHSLAITDTGNVIGWGYNVHGELGLGNTTYQPLPVQIQYFKDIKVEKVSAGYNHTIILSADGNVYTFGHNDHGQLGTGDKINKTSPFKVNINHHGPIVDVVSHMNSNISAAVTANGFRYVWGECREPIGDLLNPIFIPNGGSLYDVFGLFAKTQATYRSLALTVAYDNPMLKNLTLSFDDQIYSNFLFVIDDQRIHVHKEYLYIRCKRMDQMMRLLDTNQTEVVISGYSYDAFKAFLRYLYTNDMFVAPDIAVELLGLADTYAETDLKRKCTRLLCNGITFENVALIYSAAVQHNLSDLEKICFQYALDNWDVVSKTTAFLGLNIEIRFKFLNQYTINTKP